MGFEETKGQSGEGWENVLLLGLLCQSNSFIHLFIQYLFTEGLPCEGIPEQKIRQMRAYSHGDSLLVAERKRW